MRSSLPAKEQLSFEFREATEEDYQGIYETWMEVGVIEWMSFISQSQEQFKKNYAELKSKSKIFVIVAKNSQGEENIAGVKRISIGTGSSQDIAGYYSFGIRKQYRGLGLAKIFYKQFEEYCQANHVKRIEFTQSGSNFKAFALAKMNDFNQEAVFPDWLQRSSAEGQYYLIERYLYRFLDKSLESYAKSLPSLKYDEVYPQLDYSISDKITIEKQVIKKELDSQVTTVFKCHSQDQLLFALDYEPDCSVIQHIGFVAIKAQEAMKQNLPEAALGIYQIIKEIVNEKRVKKIELFTHDRNLIVLCQRTGFYVRGEKLASYYDAENKQYHNELGLEYSFFNLEDAKALVRSQISQGEFRNRIESTLDQCLEAIKHELSGNSEEMMQRNYLENLVYQIVRDELGPKKIFSVKEKRWEKVLPVCPFVLQESIALLRKQLVPCYQQLKHQKTEQLRTNQFSLFSKPKEDGVTPHEGASFARVEINKN